MAITKTRGSGATLMKLGPVAAKDGGNVDVGN